MSKESSDDDIRGFLDRAFDSMTAEQEADFMTDLAMKAKGENGGFDSMHEAGVLQWRREFRRDILKRIKENRRKKKP